MGSTDGSLLGEISENKKGKQSEVHNFVTKRKEKQVYDGKAKLV